MSRSLRLFVRFLATLLVIAIAAPFYLTGPGGRPLLTLDRITREIKLPSAVADMWEDPAPAGAGKLTVEGAAVYRWKDEYGIWQFGEDPPEGVSAEAMDVESKITPLGSEWQIEPSEESSAPGAMPNLPDNAPDAYTQAPKLIEKAKQVADQLEASNDKLHAFTR